MSHGLCSRNCSSMTTPLPQLTKVPIVVIESIIHCIVLCSLRSAPFTASTADKSVWYQSCEVRICCIWIPLTHTIHNYISMYSPNHSLNFALLSVYFQKETFILTQESYWKQSQRIQKGLYCNCLIQHTYTTHTSSHK